MASLHAAWVVAIAIALAAVLLAGCTGATTVMETIGAGIVEFEAVPNEGPAPLAVMFEWRSMTVRDVECEILIDGRVVAEVLCEDERWSSTFSDPGVYAVVLRNTITTGEDATRVLVLPPDEAEAERLWVLIATVPNPDERPPRGQIPYDNVDYTGFKTCQPRSSGISYHREWSYRQIDKYTMDIAFRFSAPPAAIAAGATITIPHSLQVSGSAEGNPYGFNAATKITANLGDVPGGKLAMNATSALQGRGPKEASDTAVIRLPADGDRFLLSAELIDDEPRTSCAIDWVYELR